MIALLLSLVAATVTAAPPDTIERAVELMQSQRWAEAETVCRHLVQDDPRNAEAWFRLATSLRQEKRFPDAQAAYHQAIDHGYARLPAVVGLAMAHGQAGDTTEGLRWLEEAVSEGVTPGVLRLHPGLAALREAPGFAALVTRAEEKAFVCEHDPRYGAFDFWVGDWDVFTNGQKVGHNRIEKILRGCVLRETWTSAAGDSGQSFNYFDPARGTWKQNWVDETGGVVWYEGKVADGAMHYEGENVQPDGTRMDARCVLTPAADGTVHHHIDTSTDGGKTWQVYFDADYRKAGS
jgi:hypothetical protein